MSLYEILSEPPNDAHPGAGCTVGQWLHTLDEEDRESVRGAFEDDRWEGAALWRTLKEHIDGVTFSADTLRRHRSNGCLCDEAGLR